MTYAFVLILLVVRPSDAADLFVVAAMSATVYVARDHWPDGYWP